MYPLSDFPHVSGLAGSHEPRIIQTTGLSLLEVYNSYIDAFGSLSLATNILAISLIAYKAWYVLVTQFSGSNFVNHTQQGAQTDCEEVLLRSRNQIPGIESAGLSYRVG